MNYGAIYMDRNTECDNISSTYRSVKHVTNFSHEICRKRLTFFSVNCLTPDNIESLYLNSNAIRNLCRKVIHTEKMYSYLENVFIFHFNRSNKKSKQHFATFYKSCCCCCCWILFEKFLDFFAFHLKTWKFVEFIWVALVRCYSNRMPKNHIHMQSQHKSLCYKKDDCT